MSRGVSARPRVPALLSSGGMGRALIGTSGTSLIVQLTLVGTGVLLARALGPVDRGHFALVALVAAIAWQLGPLGIPQAITFFIARAPRDSQAILHRIRAPYVRQMWIATVAATAVFVAVTHGQPTFVQIGAIIGVLTVPGSITQQAGFAVLQALKMFTPFNLLRILRNGSFLVLGGILFAIGKNEFIPLIVAWGVSRVLGAPIAMVIGLRRAREISGSTGDEATSEPSVSSMRKFGLKALLGASSPIEGFRLDQSAVALFLAPISLGYYVVALAFTNFPRFIGMSVGQVAYPYVAARREHGNAVRLMWQLTAFGGAILAVVIGVLWLMAPTLVTAFFGAEFEQTTPVVRILLIGSFFYGVRRVLSDGSRGAGYPVPGSVAEVLSLLTAIVLFPVLIPLTGIEGAAYAMTAASLVAFTALVVGVVRARHRAPLPVGWSPSDESETDLDM